VWRCTVINETHATNPVIAAEDSTYVDQGENQIPVMQEGLKKFSETQHNSKEAIKCFLLSIYFHFGIYLYTYSLFI